MQMQVGEFMPQNYTFVQGTRGDILITNMHLYQVCLELEFSVCELVRLTACSAHADIVMKLVQLIQRLWG